MALFVGTALLRHLNFTSQTDKEGTSIRPVIKWSGSKRSQADRIISQMPTDFDTYYEPFVGGGSVLYTLNPEKAICGDICVELIELWKAIQENPTHVANEYERMWHELQAEGKDYYYRKRDEFNLTRSPYILMFLSRTCVNGLIRFNSSGAFNSSFHYTRKGINPDTLRDILLDWSSQIQHVTFVSTDYRETTKNITSNDFVYLDPPYFHTTGMYYGGIDYPQFIEYLRELNRKGVRYILSYDGVRGDQDNTVALPSDVYKRHLMQKSGQSGLNRVLNDITIDVYESLYLNY